MGQEKNGCKNPHVPQQQMSVLEKSRELLPLYIPDAFQAPS
jgi:hypothetical protein